LRPERTRLRTCEDLPSVNWVLDCDGVVWLGDELIPGSAEAVAELRGRGVRVVFLTNNSYPRRSDHVAKLASLGIPTEPEDVLSSAMACAQLLQPGERALVLGGPGIVEELTARGVSTVTPVSDRPDKVDAVVVGFDPHFDFAALATATRALRAGARLVGTNDDATYPSPDGVLPGAGSLLAAVARGGGAEPVVAGKPYPPTVRLVKERVGDVDLAVGDRASTDGLLARALGTRFGLVLTGVTPAGHGPLDPSPDVEAPDLAALVKAELG
jgi:HAD superfamily hydrolase (TIGR01450 family)